MRGRIAGMARGWDGERQDGERRDGERREGGMMGWRVRQDGEMAGRWDGGMARGWDGERVGWREGGMVRRRVRVRI